MSEGLVKLGLGVFGALVGAFSMYVTMVSRIESKVEKETTMRVTQAVLERDLNNLEQKWWLQMGETNSVRAEINALRVQMAKVHKTE